MSKLSLKEIAKLVRDEIKAAVKAGELPKGIKVSVTTDYYSMGCALHVVIKALPEGHGVHSPAFIAYQKENPHAPLFHYPEEAKERYAPVATAVLAKLESIVDAYHDDRSYWEPSGDRIYNVNFSKHIGIYWELEHADRKRIEAELAAAKEAAEQAPTG